MDMFNNNHLTVVDFTAPAIEGSNISVNVTCSLSLTLNFVITCIDENWELSPSQILERCEGMLIITVIHTVYINL